MKYLIMSNEKLSRRKMIGCGNGAMHGAMPDLLHLKRLSLVLGLVFFGTGLYCQDSIFINPQGIELVLIKPGKMIVGKFQPAVFREDNSGGRRPASPDAPPRPTLQESDYVLAEQMAKNDALPGFEVEIERPFYIGKYEITQGQWKKVMGSNPSYFQGDKVEDNADQHPVESVSWQDVQVFIKELNALDKNNTYRLPTEFEWEYASRAGADDDIPRNEVRGMAVIGSTTTSEVGTKKPNAWGLYDTLGNVWEWVQDYYNEKLFADPVPSEKGKEHVIKGAPFYGGLKNATYMTHAGGPGSVYDVGFRLVMETK
jgi:formylglycine-generating enzyme required for sulfatase activity